jgi:ribosomal protein S18 acetylase RimI-like enzyme
MMVPITTTQSVYDAIAQVKAGAGAFCTNFYPTPTKLEGWIARQELWTVPGRKTVFFLRRECDFWHLHFCAPDAETLGRELIQLPELRTEKIVSDIIGASHELLPGMERAGLRRYKQLLRMTRVAQQEASPDDPWREQVAFASEPDAEAVLGLIQSAFNHYAKQIPSPEEIRAAIQAFQIIILKLGSQIAGLLHFETHGATSTLRFWTVSQRFRDRRVGGALMRHYLASQSAVRRFVLWVDEGNDDAIRKYRRYHYDNDGVSDHILANPCIPQ